MGQGGRHWQDFLSDGCTRYVEIQAGLTRTQQEHLPMPDRTVWEWLEAYGSLTCDVTTLSHKEAALSCQNELEKHLPYAVLNDEQKVRGARIATARGTLVAMGSGWGALENARRKHCGLPALSAICLFPENTMD